MMMSLDYFMLYSSNYCKYFLPFAFRVLPALLSTMSGSSVDISKPQCKCGRFSPSLDVDNHFPRSKCRGFVCCKVKKIGYGQWQILS